MGLKTTAIALALAVAGTVSLSAGAAIASQANPIGSAAQDRNQRVCRTVIPSGSRLGERVCRTQAGWDARRENARRFVEDGQNEGSRRDGEFNTPE